MFKSIGLSSIFTCLIIECLFFSGVSHALKRCTKDNCCYKATSGNGTPYCNHSGYACKTKDGLSSSCLHVKCPCTACGFSSGNLDVGCSNN